MNTFGRAFAPDDLFSAFMAGIIIGMIGMSYVRDAWDRQDRP